MAVFNDGHDNQEDYKADLAWEYRKGGPNDPNLYAEEEPEEDAEEEVRLIDANALKKEFCKDIMGGLNWERIIDNAPTVEERIDPNDIFYLCDREKCGENHNCYLCNHTTDIRHAVNFDLVEFPRSAFVERSRPRGEWIAVKDKYPDTEGFYLVSLENGRIVVADERSIIENHDFEPRMMAWQPLPEPYRAEVDT